MQINNKKKKDKIKLKYVHDMLDYSLIRNKINVQLPTFKSNRIEKS